MGRSNAVPAEGHNSKGLTPDEREALGVHHQVAISAAQKKLDVALAEVSGLRKVVNGNFKRMTADLGFTRDRFQGEVLDKLSMTPAEYANYVAETDALHRIAGLKTGEQLDLIEHVLKDTVDESEAAFQDGFRTGRRADDPTPPDHVSPILHTKWMDGWHSGQAYNGMQLTKAAEVLARPKAGEMVAGDDPDEDEGGEEDVDDLVDEGAKALKASGWVAPTEAEAQFEEADGGRTVRKPRAGRGNRAAEQAEAA